MQITDPISLFNPEKKYLFNLFFTFPVIISFMIFSTKYRLYFPFISSNNREIVSFVKDLLFLLRRNLHCFQRTYFSLFRVFRALSCHRCTLSWSRQPRLVSFRSTHPVLKPHRSPPSAFNRSKTDTLHVLHRDCISSRQNDGRLRRQNVRVGNSPVGSKFMSFSPETSTSLVSRGTLLYRRAAVQVCSSGVRWGSMRGTRGVPPEVITSPWGTPFQ
jgi:hypothetical protein